jgi:hypothetical protein
VSDPIQADRRKDSSGLNSPGRAEAAPPGASKIPDAAGPSSGFLIGKSPAQHQGDS